MQLFVNSKLLKILAFDDQITEIIGIKAEKYYEMILTIGKLDDLINQSFNGQLAKIEVGPSKRDNELVLCNLDMIFLPNQTIIDVLKLNPDESLSPAKVNADLQDPLRIKKKLKFGPFEMD